MGISFAIVVLIYFSVKKSSFANIEINNLNSRKIAEESVEIIQPTDDELRTHYLEIDPYLH